MGGCGTGVGRVAGTGRRVDGDLAAVTHWLCAGSTLSPRMIRGDKVAVAHFQSVIATLVFADKGA